jgi:hypothetical protein
LYCCTAELISISGNSSDTPAVGNLRHTLHIPLLLLPLPLLLLLLMLLVLLLLL